MDDPRFQKIAKDPRFRRLKKKQEKIQIDNRFSSMFKNEEFQPSAEKVDRFGRKVEEKTGEELKRFYHIEEDESENEAGPSTMPAPFDPARGEGVIESSSEDDSDLFNDEEFDEEELDIEYTHPLALENVEYGDETKRFAAVNMDWDKLKAIDLFKAFDSFKPATGIVKSVSIYPSEFGKERLSQEAIEGPPKEIFKPVEQEDINRKRNKLKLKEEKKKAEEKEEKAIKKEFLTEDNGEDFNEAALKKYQLERLKYYYAVVECDSVETATVIYKSCDGIEFEKSANFFDLRFIPDDMEFEDQPVDVATEAPLKYEPKDFTTNVLQHSKVKLTWDEDDIDRKIAIKKAFKPDAIENMDLNAYLASSDSEEEDAKKYRDLLLGVSDANPFEKERKMEEVEVTFATGFGGKVAGENDENSDIEENIFAELDQNSDVDEENKLVSDDENKKASKRKNKRKNIDPKDAAELELLMMSNEEEEEKKHFSMKEIIKNEQKSKKKKNKKNIQKDDFQIDTSDARFQAVFDQPEFSIDPTNPQFKETSAMRVLLDQKLKRKSENQNENSQPQKKKFINESLNSLVQSVKAKNQVFESKKKIKK